MTAVLNARVREDLTGSTTRKIRLEGYVPAIVYGKKIGSQPISVEGIEFTKTIRSVGRNGLFSLDVSGSGKHQVLIHDIQTDPLKNEYIHVDFFEVDMNSEIDANVTVRLAGEAPGEKEGGLVAHLLYELSVRCLPSDIPEEIVVDVSNLHIGDSIQVRDIRSTTNATILNDDEETLVTVQVKAAEQEDGQQPDEEKENAAEEAKESGE